ncbi:MAG: UDP-N-acetylmuramate--alanine ligase [Candidatus Saganbacteria bacterium]|uniref:UDP-N-acetylmuramate--L-alanine ligase n=1 Tax=Candidatus Saganbacteria bacterium TaxID=2575572 RepID=A0A833NZX8_UNCSA|nr:MAG: UDP-N-acetylmuramate--alanine ligase [Candidatus Saganbacteria bacterium]
MKSFDIERIKRIHLIGIGGCGVSAIGKILFEMGYKVSGSDIKENSNTMRLKDLGVKIFIGHDASHLRGADLIVYSSAISAENPEFQAAITKNMPILKRAEMLSFIMNKHQKRIAVAGTHGKTTTTSMVAKILLDAGLDPTFLIGGETDYIDGNARMGKGWYAVAEADESDGSFLELSPNISIVTNIEPDHMEYFGTEDNLLSIFEKFINRLEEGGTLILGNDNSQNRGIKNKVSAKTITYGFNNDSDLTAENLNFHGTGSRFDVFYHKKRLGEAILSVPGEQNVSNSLAAILLGLEAGAPFTTITTSLHSFTGAKRRFQIVGDFNDIIIIDDYAHHPTEIKATLKAAKLAWNGKKRIISVFQPHRYSRTFHLAKDFSDVFNDADIAILTDIYSAGEAAIPNVNGKMLVKEVEKNRKITYIPKKEKIAEQLIKILKPNDVVIIMGAGDINTVCKELLMRLKIIENENPKK